MTTGFEDFSDLEGASASLGGGGAERTAPEDEFFHSIYVSGKSRKNDTGVKEEGGKLQIRGVTYNHEKLHMIITHTKDIKLKEKEVQNKTNHAKRKQTCLSLNFFRESIG